MASSAGSVIGSSASRADSPPVPSRSSRSVAASGGTDLGDEREPVELALDEWERAGGLERVLRRDRGRTGRGSGRVTPSTVTWCSSIASSSADWVRGVARFSSSTSTTLAKSGPGRNSHSLPARWNTETPVSSDGSRSGVAWTRRKIRPAARASALASSVLPTPGTSSRSRWPPESSVTTASRTGSGLPRRTRPSPSRRSAARRWEVARSASGRASVRIMRQFVGRIGAALDGPGPTSGASPRIAAP